MLSGLQCEPAYDAASTFAVNAKPTVEERHPKVKQRLAGVATKTSGTAEHGLTASGRTHLEAPPLNAQRCAVDAGRCDVLWMREASESEAANHHYCMRA